jgi:hypothetical protein
MTDIEKLSELVERCRDAYAERRLQMTVKPGADTFQPWLDALTAYDAAQGALGAEWRAIGELVEAAKTP